MNSTFATGPIGNLKFHKVSCCPEDHFICREKTGCDETTSQLTSQLSLYSHRTTIRHASQYDPSKAQPEQDLDS
jgi:hypothetical protein